MRREVAHTGSRNFAEGIYERLTGPPTRHANFANIFSPCQSFFRQAPAVSTPELFLVDEISILILLSHAHIQ